MDHAELRHAIMYQAMDLFAFNDEGTNWHPKIFELYETLKKERIEGAQKQIEARMSNTSPSLDWNAYTGTYHHPLCGTLKITSDNETLKLDFNEFQQIEASHWHLDTFMTKPNKRWTSASEMVFHINGKAKVESLEFSGYTFTKSD